jgi:hypothetical protein
MFLREPDPFPPLPPEQLVSFLPDLPQLLEEIFFFAATQFRQDKSRQRQGNVVKGRKRVMAYSVMTFPPIGKTQAGNSIRLAR